jgi:hypothetical protein
MAMWVIAFGLFIVAAFAGYGIYLLEGMANDLRVVADEVRRRANAEIAAALDGAALVTAFEHTVFHKERSDDPNDPAAS